MVGPITNTPNVNINALQALNAGHKTAAQKDDNIVARGVGKLQKLWLLLSGKAKEQHNTQLQNLRAQVKHQFGEGGLMVLNDKLSAKKWDSKGSTKLFSEPQLNSLLKEAKDGASSAEFKLGIYQEALINAKYRVGIEALDAEKLQNGDIEQITDDLFTNQKEELIETMLSGPNISRFEAIQTSPSFREFANQKVGSPSIEGFLSSALFYLKLDPARDISSEMISKVIWMVESYCVKGAPQEITLAGQKFDAPMKEAMGESLEELHHALEDGSQQDQIRALNNFFTGNLKDFNAAAFDMYFDKLDPHLTEITPSLEKAFRSALPELAHAEAKRLVGESKAGLVAEKRNQIENELQFNLSKRDDYPHIEDVVKSIVDKIQDTEGTGATEVTYLNLVDDIGSQVNYADRNIGDIIYGDDHVFDDLTSLTIRILNPEASWESDIPPAERHMLEAALDNLLASSHAPIPEKQRAASAFINTLRTTNTTLSTSYYHQHLATDERFVGVMNTEAENIANKQLSEEWLTTEAKRQ